MSFFTGNDITMTTTPAPRKAAAKCHVLLRVEPTLLDELTERAKVEGVSRNALVERVLRDAIDHSLHLKAA
jgi:predicted HicB family RNase H-like nuclease